VLYVPSAARAQVKQNKTRHAKLVLQKIVPLYENGIIPMITAKKACEKIIALFQKNAKLRELPVYRRSSTSTQAKLKDAQIELAKTFPLWAKDAVGLIKNPEDLKFLKSMKTDQTASFDFDEQLALQLKRRTARLGKEEEGDRRPNRNRLLQAVAMCKLSSSQAVPVAEKMKTAAVQVMFLALLQN
jgi:hypothetical protein